MAEENIPVGTEEENNASFSDLFADQGSGFDTDSVAASDDGGGEEETPADEPVAAVEAEPAPEPSEEEPPPASAEAKPKAEKEKPKKAEAGAEPKPKAEAQPEPEPEPKSAEPETPPVNMEELRANVQKTLEERYKLSEEDAEALAVNPAEVMPKLAARLYTDIFEGVVAAVHGQVPFLMERYNASVEQYKGDVTEVQSAFPQIDLNNAEHLNVFRSIGQFWRARNPKASREQALRAIGNLTMVELGLTPAPAAPKPAPAPRAKPAAPRASLPQSPVVSEKTTNLPGGAPASGSESSDWGGMSEEFRQLEQS